VKQQQGEQATDLGCGGVRFIERTANPDGEAAQIPSDRRLVVRGPVPFVEQQMNGDEDRIEAIACIRRTRAFVISLLAEPAARGC
jgi:hypothetical protein